ncbi:MFS transporter [Microlunatus antarcticus]|uniref:EmrB/QacA subfamily drug resistance transporter n=1 Tax=Microlunatus antarcticus TaxID=53388 RepID=A0A7W5P8K3_9ACTN|nr:EmrB/QacA subfamily drug resistance transporter [Microlunatus antarcticus]
MAPSVRLGTAQGRWVLAATIAGSGMAFLDSTVVNVALAQIGDDFDAGFTALQWITNAYTLTLAALILLGGVLGDRLGRRRVFLVGVVWFAVASALCALSPSTEVLIAARALQGIGGALLTPGSLSIISSVFASEDQPRAVGTWAGLSGLSGAVGPFLGGWLVAVDWRLVFLVNLPIAAVVLYGTLRHVPESRDTRDAVKRLDLVGTLAIVASLTGLTWSLTEAGARGWTWPVVLAGVGGVAAGVVFVVVEQRSSHPLVPLEIFKNRVFSATNVATFFVYGALGVYGFLVILQLQVVAGWSPLAAGTAMLPATVLMLLLSSRVGGLASRTGPRVLMTAGILLAAASFALATRIGPDARWLTDVAPSAVLLGLGMSLTVAPLTATVLAAAPEQLSGAASGVNNAVARTAGLLAVAVVPSLAGLSKATTSDPSALQQGFPTAMLIGAGAVLVGAVVSWFGLGREARVQRASDSSAEPVNR